MKATIEGAPNAGQVSFEPTIKDLRYAVADFQARNPPCEDGFYHVDLDLEAWDHLMAESGSDFRKIVHVERGEPLVAFGCRFLVET
jgi:hypothetical protein